MPKIEAFPPEEGDQDNGRQPPSPPLADLQAHQRLFQWRDTVRRLNGEESEPPDRAHDVIALNGSDRFRAVYSCQINTRVINSALVTSHDHLDLPEWRVQIPEASSSRDSIALPRSEPGGVRRSRRRASCTNAVDMSLTVAARGGAFRGVQPEEASGGSMVEPSRQVTPSRETLLSGSARYIPQQPVASVAPPLSVLQPQPSQAGARPQLDQGGSHRRRVRLFQRADGFPGDSSTEDAGPEEGSGQDWPQGAVGGQLVLMPSAEPVLEPVFGSGTERYRRRSTI